jgi:heme exporter protein D
MQWHSVSEFFAMGGYAGYVWGSVGACAVAIAIETWLVRRRHRQLVHMLRRRSRNTAAPGAGQASGPTRGQGQTA